VTRHHHFEALGAFATVAGLHVELIAEGDRLERIRLVRRADGVQVAEGTIFDGHLDPTSQMLQEMFCR
jgi:hypothetical protein